jgi:hypothetical protein
VTTRLLVPHERLPDAVGIEVLPVFLQEGCGGGLSQPGSEAFPDQATLAIPAVGVESIANDGAAFANHVGHHSDEGARHFGKVDVGIRDGGRDGERYLPDVCDAHEISENKDEWHDASRQMKDQHNAPPKVGWVTRLERLAVMALCDLVGDLYLGDG